MKIAVYYNLPTGGAKRILFEQIKFLSKKHDIDVYTLSSFKEDILSLKKYSKNYYIYDFELKSKLPLFLARLHNDYKNFITLKKLHQKIARDIDSRKYDFAFIHTDVLTESPYVLRFLKTPKIYYCEELLRIAYEKELSIENNLFITNRLYENFTRWIRKNIDKNNAQKANLILTSSNFMKDRIKNAYKRDSIVCYPGVDCDSFKPMNVKKENQVLFLGNKTKIDGYFLIFDAIKNIPKDKRPFLKVLHFSKNGPTIKNDSLLAKEYSKSILTICADISEPFGLKVLESLACGTPVIAVNDGGYKETLRNALTGYLVDRNPEEISNKVLYLINNIKKYQQLSSNARKDMLNNWQWKDKCKFLEIIMFSFIKNQVKEDILISSLDSGGIGGAEFFTLQLSDIFRSKNYKTTFLTYKNSEVLSVYKDNKLEVYLTPFRMDVIGYWKGIIKFFVLLTPSLFVYIKTLKDFKQKSGKVILMSGISDKILLTPIAKYLGIKTIWIEYADPTKILSRNLGIPKYLYYKILKLADEYVVPTKNLKDKLSKRKTFDDREIQVIPCGIKVLSNQEISLYRRNKENVKKKMGIDGKKVIGMISRLEKGKGQDVLLKTIQYLKNKIDNFIIVLAGEGDYTELKQFVKEKKIQKYVKFLGFYKDRYELLSTFDVFVFPTNWELEGFGLVSLEAMLMRVPLITSNIDVVKEVVGDSALISKITPEDLSKSIVKVLLDKRLSEKLIKKGTKRVNTLYDIYNIANKYLKLIN